MDQVGHERLSALALSRGLISPQQARAAAQVLQASRTGGREPRLGQALMQIGALREDQLRGLLRQLGLAAVVCPRCRRGFDVPMRSLAGLRCPQDGAALVLVEPQASGEDRTVIEAPRGGTGVSRSGTGPILSASGEGADKYTVEKELARGGMGAIYLAEDRGLARTVAMKVMLDPEDRLAYERFQEEARITGQLEHPNIVPVHELGARRGQAYFTMKFVRGRSLSRLIEQLRSGAEPLALGRVLSLFMKVLDGVGFAHANDVIHRDLKPDNIMLGEHGEVLVMDWGIAKLLGRPEPTVKDGERVRSLRELDEEGAGGSWTMPGSMCGTPGYMAPEQADGDLEKVEKPADIFALGCILYELLTYEKAFSGPAMQAINRTFKGEYKDPLAFPERKVPIELAAVVRKALQVEPAERYQSISELQSDIQAFLDGRSVSAHRDPLAVRAAKWVRRHPTLSASAAILAAAVVAALGYVTLRPARLRIKLQVTPQEATLPAMTLRINGRALSVAAGSREVETRVWLSSSARIELAFEEGAAAFIAPEAKTVDRLSAGDENAVILSIARRVVRARPSLRAGKTVAVSLEPISVPFFKTLGTIDFSSADPREVPAGRYRATFSRPGAFPITREWDVDEGEGPEVALEDLVWFTLEFREPIVDYAIGDVDQDGVLDLVLSTAEVMEAWRLQSRPALLWRRVTRPWADGPRGRGSIFQLADFRGDGSLTLLVHDGLALHAMDPASGLFRDKIDLFQSRFRARDLDGDGRSEIVVGTGYEGLQALELSGERRWGLPTEKNASFSSLEAVPIGAETALLGHTVRPFRVYAARGRDGALLWDRRFPEAPDGEFRAWPSPSGEGRALIATQGELRSVDARDGREVWKRKGGFRSMAIGRFDPRGPTRIMALSPSGLACIDEDGELAWEKPLRHAGLGSFGDVDEDGALEFLQPCDYDRGRRSVWLKIFEADGSSAGAIEVPAERPYHAKLPPVVVKLDPFARPAVLVFDHSRVRLCRLKPRSGARSSDWTLTLDLDGRGDEEVLVYKAGRSLTCRGGVEWTVPNAATPEGFRLNLDLYRTQRSDVDGDGCQDLVLFGQVGVRPAGGADAFCVTALSGRDGAVLFTAAENDVYGLRPLPEGGDGSWRLVLTTSDAVKVLRYDRAERALDDPILTFKSFAGLGGGSFPFSKGDGEMAVVADPTRVYLSCGLNAVLRLDPAAGLRQVSGRAPEIISPASFRAFGEGVLFGGALGSLFYYEDGRRLQRTRGVLGDNIQQIITRRSPGGTQVVVSDTKGGIAFLDSERKLVAKRSFTQFETGRWKLLAADLDGDETEEVLVALESGRFFIVKFDRGDEAPYAWVHSRLEPRGFSSQQISPKPQLTSLEGRLDLRVHSRSGTMLYPDLPRLLARARAPFVSPEPLITRALARESLSLTPRAAGARRRLDALPRTSPIRARAEGGLLPRDPEAAVNSGQYLEALIAAAERGAIDAAPLLERSRRELAGSLSAVADRIDEIEDGRLRAKLDGHFIAAFRGEAELADRLLSEGRLARSLGSDGQAESSFLALARFFPDRPRSREPYSEAVIAKAMMLYRGFQRAEPVNLLAAAIKRCPSSALLCHYAWLHRLRRFEPAAAADRAMERAVAEAGAFERSAVLAERAHFHWVSGRKAAAFADVKAARALGEPGPALLVISGILACDRGRLDEGMRDLDRGLAGSWEDRFGLRAKGRYLRLRLRLRRGDVDGAWEDLQAYRRLRSSNGSSAGQEIQAARLFAGARRPDLARRILEDLRGLPEPAAGQIEALIKQLGR